MKNERSCVETSGTRRRDAQQDKRDRGVDLELVDEGTAGTKLDKDSDFGGGDEVSGLIGICGEGALRATETNHELATKAETETEKNKDKGGEDVTAGPSGPSSPSPAPCSHAEPGQSLRVMERRPAVSKAENDKKTREELHTSDNHLSGKTEGEEEEEEEEEEDDGVSSVLSDDCVPCALEDESHYITTHEIQLSELSDSEGDYDLGVGSSAGWEVEDGGRAYAFVDYASFDGDGAAGERGGSAAVSTLLESDPRDAAKFASSDESVSKSQEERRLLQQEEQEQQRSGNSAGQIHLSIRATSRAINDPSNIQERGNILYHARRSGDASRYVLRGVDGKAEALRDGASCVIAAPGRLHFGGILRGKEVTGYSSGTSSAVSELDDADKEVRNLTAGAFRSLAYPYFDAINFSTSSESSASEHGLGINRWSTFVDLKYGNVNMSRGLDKSVVSHKNPFEIAKNTDNRGYKGAALASIKPPTSRIFTLNGDPHSEATKRIELMGKFGQGHGGVIRLTETLNFRCNVKSGMSAGERRTNFAQNAAGSRSTDEVTDTLQSGQRREASKPPCKTMEDTHKKAIFASSLIKNVISKKMQFEQERKMERGEISEPHRAPSPCFAHQEGDGHRGKGSRELHRQSSRFSECSSDYTVMCVDELGDIVDSGSCDTRSDSRRRDAAAPETNLEPANEAGIDTKKGALEASKSTLLRSQNSAFRCWKDEELEFQKDHKNDKTPEDKLPPAYDKEGEGDQRSAGSGRPTKMSHLFVPSIQLLPSDGEVGQQLRSANYSQCGGGGGGGIKLRSDNTLYVADSGRVATSKSPEIKINLRSIRDNKTEPFGVSKLRAPNIGCNAASLIRTDDFKCQALAAALKGESSDKVPHFMVRDIRDNKGKLQTPIHQVRDVRKLVKSSYHFVSLDNVENKSNFASVDNYQEHKKQMSSRNNNSVSPIVIKCQSVNTNSHGKQSGNYEVNKREPFDADRLSPEGAKSAPPQRRSTVGPSNSCSDGSIGLRIESRAGSVRQEKASDAADKKPESKMANQVALQKLQAAVKTMEQLYVFEKNEWKRKNEPQPLTDSHVLSLIASEEHGGPEEEGARGSSVDKVGRRDSYPNMDKTPPALPASPNYDGLLRRDDKDLLKTLQSFSSYDDRLGAKSLQGTGSKNMFSLSSSVKSFTPSKTPQTNTVTQTPFSAKTFVPKSPKLPVTLKTNQTRLGGNEGAESKEADRFAQEYSSSSADSENYLTIPVKSHLANGKQQPSAEKTSVYTYQSNPTTPPGFTGAVGQEDHNQTPNCSSFMMETQSPEIPPATIYHSLPVGMSANQPQLYCFSPAITPAPTLDPFQATQRKMLLDPTTGSYYLVDTPVQPATKRLFDPETGQYVDVPMPQPPMTPVPMPMSPLALSPGAYGHTYMIYPGFMPAPSVIPARALVQSQMSMQSEPESAEKVSSQPSEGLYMESPYYMATGKTPQMAAAAAATGAQQQAAANRPLPPQGFMSMKQPVISITSQQGPRIIAPPSFDGTTMSFVVEHR